MSVFIHDFEAMDRRLLSQPTRHRSGGAALAGPQRGSGHGLASGTVAGMSVAELRADYGDLLFDGVGPLSHVRDHLVSGNPIYATYLTSSEGQPIVHAIGDATGDTHDH